MTSVTRKDPHPERGGFLLLPQCLEMVLKRRMVRVAVRIGVRGEPVRQL
jgi:hypothetical protein